MGSSCRERSPKQVVNDLISSQCILFINIYTNTFIFSKAAYEPFPNPTVHSLLENYGLVMPIKPLNYEPSMYTSNHHGKSHCVVQ